MKNNETTRERHSAQACRSRGVDNQISKSRQSVMGVVRRHLTRRIFLGIPQPSQTRKRSGAYPHDWVHGRERSDARARRYARASTHECCTRAKAANPRGQVLPSSADTELQASDRHQVQGSCSRHTYLSIARPMALMHGLLWPLALQYGPWPIACV